MAKQVVNPGAISYANISFKPFKSSAKDGMFHALLQKGVDILLPHLSHEIQPAGTQGERSKLYSLIKRGKEQMMNLNHTGQ